MVVLEILWEGLALEKPELRLEIRRGSRLVHSSLLIEVVFSKGRRKL